MSSTKDERKPEELFTARPPPGSDASDVYSASTVASQASADLLELVRSAEEEATVATSRRPAVGSAASVNKLASAPPQPEEYVDVDGEAIDAPPSLPPIRSATPATELKVQDPPITSAQSTSTTTTTEDLEQERVSAVPPSAVTVKKTPVPIPSPPIANVARKLESVERSTFPPAASIALFLSLAIGVLFVITR